jgi:hypothetical protein
MERCYFATRPDGVLSVCMEVHSRQFIGSFIPRLAGGVLNESGILEIGQFQSAEEARKVLIDRYGEPDKWVEGHPEALTCGRTVRNSSRLSTCTRRSGRSPQILNSLNE